MLKKAGQSIENVAGTRNAQIRPRPATINNVLEEIGDDAEIEIDFSGFVNPETASSVLPPAPGRQAQPEKKSDGEAEVGTGLGQSRRSKEAGTTSKERFNYAKFDCAAAVLKFNPECSGATSILSETKDTYMLNKCSAKNQFFIVELCEDILIDTIVLANFEFFSSTFRTFRASISDRYPVKIDKWREIGTFEARNVRSVQVFLVEDTPIWAKYLRIEFLTHYGQEYYCPVSLLRVHGKTMIDDYRNDVKAASGEDMDDDVPEFEGGNNDGQLSGVISADALKSDETAKIAEHVSPTQSTVYEYRETPIPFHGSVVQLHITPPPIPNCTTCGMSYRNLLLEQHQLLVGVCDVARNSCDMEHVRVLKVPRRQGGGTSSQVTKIKEHSSIPTSVSATHTQQQLSTKSSNASTQTSVHVTTRSSTHQTTATQEAKKPSPNASPLANSRTQGDTAGHASNKANHPPSGASPPSQESFFKSLHKRLQMLEVNSTLSLQYIEEQSRILREAFSKVEKRQLGKTTTFLDALNSTVLGELQNFRQQYDQIWQSTVLELSAQREQSQREVVALSGRLSILADEILFQKRMAIVQFVLILLCLGLVLFSKNAASPYLDFPSAVHSMVTKPSASFSRYLQLDSPPDSRPGSRYGLFSRNSSHLRNPSDELTLIDDRNQSHDADYSPPTPVSEDAESRLQSMSESPGADVRPRRTRSTPIISTLGEGGRDPTSDVEVQEYEEEDMRDLNTPSGGPEFERQDSLDVSDVSADDSAKESD
jgi:hypothetical protein